MTDYTKSTNFTAKDALPPGDTGKIVRGSEFDTEFSAVQTAVNSKADKASPTFTGTATIAGLTVSGTFTLGGVAITATAVELNVLDGITASTTELNYVDGVTSSIQTQLDGKAATVHVHAAADVTSGTFDVARIPDLDTAKITTGTFADARISQSSVTQHEAAINAGQVDGKSISVVSSLPGSPDANTIYFVTA